MKANQPTHQIGNDPTTTNNNKETNNMATTTTCQKCLGTGKYNVPLKDGSIGKCFACKGTGMKAINTNPMSEAQVKFIRSLFKQLQEFLTQEEQDEIISIMRAHIAGTQKQTVAWASAKIDELKKLQKAIDNAYNG